MRLRWHFLEAGWLDDHPLTAADLELETEYLKSAGFKLKIV